MKPIKYEIILLLDRKYTPKEIIAMGFNRITVYKYKKRWIRACEKIKELKK